MNRAAALVALTIPLALAAPARADVRDGCTVAVHPLATSSACTFAADGPIQWVSHGNALWEIDVIRGDYVEAYILGGQDSVGTWADVRAGDVVQVTIWLPATGAGVIDVREDPTAR